MDTYTIYKAVKEQLKTAGPVFYYMAQYLPGKDNTSYKVPAIYIEMPKNLTVNFYPRKIKAARGVIKVHVVSNAPFAAGDGPVQDSQLQAHQALVNSVDKLANAQVFKDGQGRLLTQQLINTGANNNVMQKGCVVNVLSYSTEMFDYNLQA